MSTAGHADLHIGEGRGDEPRDARRRRQLIEATIVSIAENGLSRTTVARVAEIAGLSAGIVNFYFKTKDALLLATLEHVDGEFGRRQREAFERAGDDPMSQLLALIEADFDPEVCDPQRVAVWTAFWGEALARDDYRRVCGAHELEQERLVVELFERMARDGSHEHLDPEALGGAFYHLLSSLPENMLNDEPFDFDAAKETCRKFLASVFPREFARATAPPHARAREVESEFDTLPAWVYHDPEFFELERRFVFQRHWLLAGHVCHVPNPGDYVTVDVAGDRALVIRGRDGSLRAFHNVCRHRASRVVEGETGSCPGAIVCPYHGWSYGLDGQLRAVPQEESFGGLDKSRLSLLEIDVEEWMGFLFVRFGGDGPSVHESLEPFAEDAGRYRMDAMQPWAPFHSEIWEANWKIFSENDAEGYHVPRSHPGLRRLFGDSYRDADMTADGSAAYARLQEKASSVWSERMYQKLLPEAEYLPEALQRTWLYIGLFPASALQITPDRVDAYQVLPVDPHRCRIRSFGVAHEDARREMRAARYLCGRIGRQVAAEDRRICRSTDAGVRSSAYRGAPLSELESGVRRFDDRLRRLIPVARASRAPAPGRVAAVDAEMRRRG